MQPYTSLARIRKARPEMPFIDQLIWAVNAIKLNNLFPYAKVASLILERYQGELHDLVPFDPLPSGADATAIQVWFNDSFNQVVKHPVFDNKRYESLILAYCLHRCSVLVMDFLEIGFDVFEEGFDRPIRFAPSHANFVWPVCKGSGLGPRWVRHYLTLVEELKLAKPRFRVMAYVLLLLNQDDLSAAIQTAFDRYKQGDLEDEATAMQSTFEDFHRQFRKGQVDQQDDWKDMVAWWMIGTLEGPIFKAWQRLYAEQFEENA